MEVWRVIVGVATWRYGGLEESLQACRHGGMEGWGDRAQRPGERLPPATSTLDQLVSSSATKGQSLIPTSIKSCRILPRILRRPRHTAPWGRRCNTGQSPSL